LFLACAGALATAFAILVACASAVTLADDAANISSDRAADLATVSQIDELLATRWTKDGIRPAPLADDAEFLRRAYLDLTGVIPSVCEARAFLEDTSTDRRGALVERLIASPAFATRLADLWRDMMLPRKFDPAETAGLIGVQNWLRRQFADNRRYDRIVADLLVASGGGESGPALFYTALDLKPEELGTTTARLFLGVRLDCAQCHNHPFDHWTQQDFWGYAAFFARLQRRGNNPNNARLADVEFGEVRLPDSDAVVGPRYPGGADVDRRELGTRREQLAIWTVSGDNPYLARATVNLVWAQLFGRGLVEPVDDMGDHNPPSHPEVMQALCESFMASGYDLRRLYRVLTNLRAYQLGSQSSGSADPPEEAFAQMAIKTLSAEQLYDSLARVALRAPDSGQDRLADPPRTAFLVKMQSQARPATQFDRGVPQALTLMNGEEMTALADANASNLLKALDVPFWDDAARLEAAFLATLARLPSDEERSRFLEYLAARPADQRSGALGDIVWALVNSAEFTLNH